MPTLQYLPAWSVEYQYGVRPNTIRTRSGKAVQRRMSHKNIVRASASLRLLGAQLPYFEYFVREVCNDGQLAFTGYYADQNGLNSGKIRILDGAYSVQTDYRRHIISCELEIFR